MEYIFCKIFKPDPFNYTERKNVPHGVSELRSVPGTQRRLVDSPAARGEPLRGHRVSHGPLRAAPIAGEHKMTSDTEKKEARRTTSRVASACTDSAENGSDLNNWFSVVCFSPLKGEMQLRGRARLLGCSLELRVCFYRTALRCCY